MPVVAGKTYRISFWAVVFQVGEIPLPTLYIKDSKAGELSFSSGEISQWKKFTVLWSAGNETSVKLSIRNATITSPGNWFAIDDIEVVPYQLAYDTVNIKISGQGVIAASADTSICRGGFAQLLATGGSNYLWSPSAGLSDPTLSNPVASPAATTKYYVSATAVGGCRARDSVVITIQQPPTVITSPDLNLCAGGTGTISASGAATYLWSPATGMTDPTLSTQPVAPLQTTGYAVVGRDVKGCADTGFVKVTVSKEASILIPNAFTPNADGINDCFRIPNANGAPQFELAVFNRFGEKVFYTKDPLTCWDGKFKGKDQAAGTFVYYLKMLNGCGEIFRKGTVTLVR
jgi:gliding motility-associated-like protein